MKKISILIFLIGGLFFNRYGANTKIMVNNSESINESVDNNFSSNQFFDSESNYSSQKIIIDSYKCIGCGRCVVVAPNNFRMNSSKGVAESVYGANISNDLANKVMNICPTRAIKI